MITYYSKNAAKVCSRYLLTACWCLVGFVPSILMGQTTLTQGDIAFVGYNSDTHSNGVDKDDFAFMLLRDITAGTSITFTDHMWLFSTGGFNETYAGACNTEAFLTWTATAALPLGTIVVIENPGPSGSPSQAAASTGTLTVQGTNCPDFQLTIAGEVLFAYQGTKPANNTATNWLACINMDGGWLSASNTTSTSASAKPGGLLDANILLLTPEVDNAVYKGTLTGNAATLRAAIYNLSNWTTSDVNAFALPQDIGSSLLPVTWGSFSVQNDAKGIQVQWTTRSEQNTAYFEVEYAPDGSNFVPLRRLIAAGQSARLQTYSTHIATQLLQPVPQHFFRIKQVDRDGHYSFTDIKRSSLEVISKQTISVVTNANAGQLQVLMLKQGALVQVFDMQGRKLAEQKASSTKANLHVPAMVGATLLLTVQEERLPARSQIVIFR